MIANALSSIKYARTIACKYFYPAIFEDIDLPANRSRTTEWRRCLQQVAQRNGSLEVAVSRDYSDNENGRHLLWRVRILQLTDSEIIVEQPMTLGHTMPLEIGVQLVAILAIGQNRWMFSTTNLGNILHDSQSRTGVQAMRLVMPQSVERCQRRNYYRVHTTGVDLPQVSIWPLLDPKTVLAAERANELEYEENESNKVSAKINSKNNDENLMPDVGPELSATILNLGGGGIGLCFSPDSSGILSRHKLYWLKFALPPELTTPICATAKLIHSHMESNQQIYAGMAFDFSFNPVHQRFLVSQICRFISIQQRDQLECEFDQDEHRKSA